MNNDSVIERYHQSLNYILTHKPLLLSIVIPRPDIAQVLPFIDHAMPPEEAERIGLGAVGVGDAPERIIGILLDACLAASVIAIVLPRES